MAYHQVRSAQIYRDHCSVTNNLIKQAKQNYYSEKIADCGRDMKCLTNITRQLLSENKKQKHMANDPLGVLVRGCGMHSPST